MLESLVAVLESNRSLDLHIHGKLFSFNTVGD